MSAASESRSRARRVILVVVGLALLGPLIWAVYRGKLGSSPARAAPADPEVPVIVTTVTQRDVPIYLNGLGNVVPMNQVTVKSQVDGRLDRVRFQEGQAVHKGDVLAEIDPRPLVIQVRRAEATLARDAADRRANQITSERTKALAAQGLATQQQVDDARAALDKSETTLALDRTQLEDARLQLGYARIASPIDGVSGIRLVDPGNIIHASDATGIVVITQLDPMAIVFTLPEDDLPQISAAQAAGPITVDAYSRDGATKRATGQLTVVDNQVSANTATVRLKAVFANPSRALWPNEFVKARLLLAVRKAATVVPAVVVQRGPTGTFAYVVGPDNTVAARPIAIESTQGDVALVGQGLSSGERVVAEGQNQLRPGSKVAPRPAEPGAAVDPQSAAPP